MSSVDPVPFEIQLGLDFGTTFTKACVYELELNRRGLCPFPERMRQDFGLLPTRLALDADGVVRFDTSESSRDRIVEYFKLGIAGMRIGRTGPAAIKGDISVPRPRVYSAYYLARVIAMVEAWESARLGAAFGSRQLEWSASVGIPVAYFDSSARGAFEEVVHVAFAIKGEVGDAERLSRLESLYREAINTPRNARMSTTPELYAEAAGLLSSYRTPDGVYALFDIGGGTLDGAALHFKRRQGAPSVNFLTSQVSPLGFEALVHDFAERLAPSTRTGRASLDKVRQAVKVHHPKLSPVAGPAREQVRRHVAAVVMGAKQRSDFDWTALRSLPVIFFGGGAGSRWHADAILGTWADRQHERCGIPRYERIDMDMFEDSVEGLDPENAGRFQVAVGLSQPEGTGTQIVGFPSRNPDLSRGYDAACLDCDAILKERYGW